MGTTTGRGAVLRRAAGRGALAEEVVDVAHKAVHSLVTGLPAERWIRPELESARGRVSH